MTEEWRPVVGYEGLYEVSNCGNVRSTNRRIKLERFSKGKQQSFFSFVKGKELRPIINRAGYARVNLCDDAGRKAKFVHRLVLEAFSPINNSFALQINHKDENPINNRADNLEWCDAKYNSNYGNHRKNLSASLIAAPNKTRKAVIAIPISGGENLYFRCGKDAERSGYNSSQISACCTGKQQSHAGYIWRFA